ncbi:oligogalacturonide lyase [Sarracenia purpurea var. burkii]
MALKRAPIDIRSQGGVAHLSDPQLIWDIKADILVKHEPKAEQRKPYAERRIQFGRAKPYAEQPKPYTEQSNCLTEQSNLFRGIESDDQSYLT